ncbi:MAG: acetyl-CoA hydrolase/transferase family protein [Syntrophomonadaceae bacterium]|nr:acetyl-CoA hydrolase/transferase family protein [Syntrophomonadaceae bacterium]
MDLKEEYRKKLMTADEAVKLIPDHSMVVTNVAVGHPVALVNALVKRQYEIQDVELFYVVDVYDTDIKNIQPDSGLRVDLGYPILHRKDVQQGKFYHTPIRFADAGKGWRELRKVTATMHLVAPMDKHGYFCMGLGADYGLPAMRTAEKILVQVSSTVPRSHGENFVHISQVDAIVEAEQQLVALPEIPPNAKEQIIGQYCAELIKDGATIQLGIGGIPNAAAQALIDKKDLGVHSEMACDTMRMLWEQGVITNRKKTLYPDRCVFTFAMGSQKLYDWIDDNQSIVFRNVEWVNDPYVIGLNDNLISINGALEVDLTGQACSESLGHLQHTHPGGQLDFVNGAFRSKGGRSILAFESVANTPEGPVSRITWQLKPGAIVTTPRHDIDCVITEYGVANLKAYSIRERAKRLIAVAHPDSRDELAFHARKLHIL